jgi:glycerophosphoryl diester phosphodiesterase
MTVVIGHRGASADFPENTLDAFAGAAAQGADWVELDVRATSDGVLVVHHDAGDRPTVA